MWVQAAGILLFVVGPGFAAWLWGAVLLGLGTALVFPTLLAAVSDVAHPEWRVGGRGVPAVARRRLRCRRADRRPAGRCPGHARRNRGDWRPDAAVGRRRGRGHVRDTRTPGLSRLVVPRSGKCRRGNSGHTSPTSPSLCYLQDFSPPTTLEPNKTRIGSILKAWRSRLVAFPPPRDSGMLA